MKVRILFLIASAFLFSSCQNNERIEKLESENQILKLRNDSLRKITDGIRDKYVFDSLTIRQIPHYKNTYLRNSEFKEEIVFVGYNLNGKTSVIIGDSLKFENGIEIINPDTLVFKNGGFRNIIELNQKQNHYSGILKSENEYGKSFKKTVSSIIQTKN